MYIMFQLDNEKNYKIKFLNTNIAQLAIDARSQ